MENLGKMMKRDARRAKTVLNEQIAAIEYYSKIAWNALKKPLTGLSMAAVLYSCGFTKNQAKDVNTDARKNKTEQIVRYQEVPTDQVIKTSDYEFGYSDPNEVAETPEEREAREAEEGFWEIMEGKQTHGNAGTDKVNYGKPGKGSPSRLTEEEVEAIYQAKSRVGRGMDNVDIDELDRQIRSRADDNSRDISWAKAVKDAGYER